MSDEWTRRAPDAILASSTMTRAEKVAALRQLAYDVRERAVAAEEGMGGGETIGLAQVQAALRALDADEGPLGDSKQ